MKAGQNMPISASFGQIFRQVCVAITRRSAEPGLELSD